MEDPDDLPRSLSYTFFTARAGQAMVINGLSATPTRLPATPQIGLEGDKVILVHLEGYEDWSPSSLTLAWGRCQTTAARGHASSHSTGHEASWTEGRLRADAPTPGDAGRWPPASTMVRRDDHDDNIRGP